jgi:hypothetical protein
MEKSAIKLGDHVNFLRSADKAVSLSGAVVKIYEDDVPCVDVKLDGHENWIETAHVDDVTPFEEAAAAKKSFTTVNGKPV